MLSFSSIPYSSIYTVSASPLMLDMTVMSTFGVIASPPEVPVRNVLPLGHCGQYYGCCQYGHAVRCTSGSRNRAAGDAGSRCFDLSAVEVTRVSFVVQIVGIVSVSKGFVTFPFARPCSASTREHIASGWRGSVAAAGR